MNYSAEEVVSILRATGCTYDAANGIMTSGVRGNVTPSLPQEIRTAFKNEHEAAKRQTEIDNIVKMVKLENIDEIIRQLYAKKGFTCVERR